MTEGYDRFGWGSGCLHCGGGTTVIGCLPSLPWERMAEVPCAIRHTGSPVGTKGRVGRVAQISPPGVFQIAVPAGDHQKAKANSEGTSVLRRAVVGFAILLTTKGALPCTSVHRELLWESLHRCPNPFIGAQTSVHIGVRHHGGVRFGSIQYVIAPNRSPTVRIPAEVRIESRRWIPLD